MTDLHQDIMNAAYDQWQQHKEWDKPTFWASLTNTQRFAVFTGNYNQQVCNGGHLQWLDNRYACKETVEALLEMTEAMKTPAARRVNGMLKIFHNTAKRYYGAKNWPSNSAREIFDVLDEQFYDGLSEQFIAECEAYLQNNKAQDDGDAVGQMMGQNI